MASTGMVHGEGFWLPSEFFSDTPEKKPENADTGSGFCFPNDFPYDFGTWDDGDFQKNVWVISTSPQSTLASMGRQNGSPNAVPSPPYFEKYNESVEDLIHRAAGEVARLKLRGGEFFAVKPIKPRHSSTPCTFNKQLPSIPPLNLQNQRFGIQYTKRQPFHEQGLTNWTVNKNPQTLRPVPVPPSTAGSAARNACTGTGVFLPRRYGNNNFDVNAFSSSVSRPKTGPSSVIHGRDHRNNMSINSGVAPYSRPKHGIHLNTTLIPDRGSHGFTSDPILALRTAILMQRQQQRLRAM